MTPTIKGLRDQKRTCVRRMRELVAAAELEKRELTPKERIDFNEAEDEAMRLTRAIEAAELGDSGATWSATELRDAIRGGFARTATFEKHKPLTRGQSFVDFAYHSDPDACRRAEGIKLGDIARAMALGPRTEAEKRALSEGTDSAGGYTTPTLISAQLIDALRESAAIFRAGAVTLPLERTGYKHNFATIASDPTATWKAENATLGATEGTFGVVSFVPKTLMVLTPASRELVEDSLNLDEALRRSFVGSMAAALDQAVLSSTGGTAPTGILNTAGISTVTAGSTNGHKLTHYTPLVTAFEQTITNNSPATAIVMATREYGDLAGLRDTTGQPLLVPPVLAPIPFVTSNRMPTNETLGSSTSCSSMLFGAWHDCVVGVRLDFRLEVLRERYADAYQFGFLGVMRVDAQLFHPASFTRLQGIDPAGTT